MKRLSALYCLLVFFIACKSDKPEQESATVGPAPQTVSYASVLDPNSTSSLKAALEAFAKGDINGFTANMDDNVKFYYPGAGDSLTGKTAVNEYYTGRWKLIDSIQMINPTMLGVQLNESVSAQTGPWSMAWFGYQINYKSGNAIYLPIHTVAHSNSAGKWDIVAMYYDMQKVMMAQRK